MTEDEGHPALDEEESLSALRERGFSAHELGDLAAAEAVYREVLQRCADDLEVMFALGHLAVQTARYEFALSLITRVIAEAPTAAAYGVLGNALHALSRLDDALSSYDRAIDIDPDLAGVHLNRALALRDLGRNHQALESFDRAIEREAAPHVLTLRGLCLTDLGRGEEALQSYDRAILENPGYFPAHINRGVLLRRLARHGEALGCFEAVLAVEANSFEALVNRGMTLSALGRDPEALIDLARGIALRPGVAAAYVSQAAVLVKLGEFERALQSYDTAIALQPDYAAAHASRASALAPRQRFDEIVSSCERAIELSPSLVDAHFNRGAALRELGRFEEALTSFETALACEPDHPAANFELGCLFLSMGRLDEGWEFYEWRNRVRDVPTHRRFVQPAWRDHEEIAGKTLFVHADQGLGDTIQFCRYVKLAEARGARVVFSVQNSLRQLLADSSPRAELLDEFQTPDAYDHHCPLSSLPRAFKTRLSTIPAVVPYLRAEPERVAAWRQRLSAHGFKIGVCWQGGTGINGAGRSFPAAALQRISTISRVRLISLQKIEGAGLPGALPPGMHLESPGEDFDAGQNAFLDTAAVMETVDLVISCDTSVAHLAGALGRPTWVALKFSPDWRWMMNRDDSPWYPSMRLFRQTTRRDWAGVFDRMYADLVRVVAHLHHE
jgi:tetratricopeptide (TPR) repeat protein